MSKVHRNIYKVQRGGVNPLERTTPDRRLYKTPDYDAVPYAHLIVVNGATGYGTLDPDDAIHTVCASVADVKWHLFYNWHIAPEIVDRALSRDGCIKRIYHEQTGIEHINIEIMPILPLGVLIDSDD